MNKKKIKYKIIKWLGLVGIMILLLPKILIRFNNRDLVKDKEQVPARPVAIVFGAGLWRDGSPTPVLRDRIETAAELYFRRKVSKLLMSGDNRYEDYNEPAAMKAYAENLGVPANDIVLDYAGRSTYDTCYRARNIFQVTDPMLVTQQFHLPRALFICKNFGLDAIGVAADMRTYRKSTTTSWEIREYFASLKAVWDVYIEKPLPVLGDPEPIFADLDNGNLTE